MKIRIFGFLCLILLASCEPENKAPDALFTCLPANGNINTIFDLDASSSADSDGLKFLLTYRWDYNGDGQWDTPFGPYKIYACRFPVPGSYEIRLEVKDSYEAVSSSIITVHVDSLHRITDPRDGQVYPVVKIGSFWWMGRNLNIGKRVDPSVNLSDNGVIEKYVYPADDPDSLNGGLYTWEEMMGEPYSEGSQGICPPGWHVPTDNDWRNMLSVFRPTANRPIMTYQISGVKYVPDQMVTYDSYLSEGALWRLLKDMGSTGFDAVMLGYRNPDGAFDDRDYYFAGKTATFWSSTSSGDYAVRVRLYRSENHDGDVFRFLDNRLFAFSVRCVKESL